MSSGGALPLAFQILPKGHLISKGHFCFVFNSSKKRTKHFCHSRLGQNLNFQVRFLEELKTPNIHFEIK